MKQLDNGKVENGCSALEGNDAAPLCKNQQHELREINDYCQGDDVSDRESTSSFESLCSFCAENCTNFGCCRLIESSFCSSGDVPIADTEKVSTQNASEVNENLDAINIEKPQKFSVHGIYKDCVVWAPRGQLMWPAVVYDLCECMSDCIYVQYITDTESSKIFPIESKQVRPFFCAELQKYRYKCQKVSDMDFDSIMKRAYDMAINDVRVKYNRTSSSSVKHLLENAEFEKRNTLQSKVSGIFVQISQSDGAKKYFNDLIFANSITKYTERFRTLKRRSVAGGFKFFPFKNEILTERDNIALLEYLTYQIASPHGDHLRSSKGDYLEFVFEVLYPECFVYCLRILFNLSNDEAYSLLEKGFESAEKKNEFLYTAVKEFEKSEGDLDFSYRQVDV